MMAIQRSSTIHWQTERFRRWLKCAALLLMSCSSNEKRNKKRWKVDNLSFVLTGTVCGSRLAAQTHGANAWRQILWLKSANSKRVYRNQTAESNSRVIEKFNLEISWRSSLQSLAQEKEDRRIRKTEDQKSASHLCPARANKLKEKCTLFRSFFGLVPFSRPEWQLRLP